MAHYNLANNLARQGQHEEAVKHYSHAVRLDPEHSRAYNNLGNELGRLERGDEAIEAYRQAVRLTPTDAIAHYNLGIALEKKERFEEAVKELLRIDPLTRAIVSSGYSNDPVMGNFEDYGFKGVVAKPYDTAELNLVLRKVTGIPRNGS